MGLIAIVVPTLVGVAILLLGIGALMVWRRRRRAAAAQRAAGSDGDSDRAAIMHGAAAVGVSGANDAEKVPPPPHSVPVRED